MATVLVWLARRFRGPDPLIVPENVTAFVPSTYQNWELARLMFADTTLVPVPVNCIAAEVFAVAALLSVRTPVVPPRLQSEPVLLNEIRPAVKFPLPIVG